ncbi:MAG: hypothetical protein M1591_04485 [Deltaproteobacteria bacterium]|nr:hypothetical protein [Deltaproteobacteria bacterium]
MAFKKYKQAWLIGLMMVSGIVTFGGTGCGKSGSSSTLTGPFVYFTGPGLYKVNINGGSVGTVAFTTTPVGLAADSTSLYFYSSSSGLNKVAKDNSSGVVNLTTNMTTPIAPANTWMAVDGSNVYWVEGGGGNGAVKKISINGGNVITLASGLPSPVSIAVDSSNVYWTDRTGLVNKVPVNSGPVTTLYDGSSFGAAPLGIAVDNGNVYWGEAELSGSVFTGGAIKKIGTNGLTVTTLASGLTSPTDLTVDSQNVYWIEYPGWTTSSTSASIMQVGINGGPVTTLATGQTDAKGIVVDSTSVYWLDSCQSGSSTGSVQKAPINGGTVTAIASGLTNPGNIAIDR